MAALNKNEIARLYFPMQPSIQPALTPVILSAQNLQRLKFSHHFTECGADPQTDATGGVSVWVAAVEGGQCAALSFDWSEIEGGVLCVRNPLAVQSNVYPIAADGRPLDQQERLRALLMAVYSLKWHDRVRDEIPRLLAA